MDPDKAIVAYVAVCRGYPIEVVNNTVLKFLRGGFEGVDKRFCPTPPELSDMLRDVMPDKPKWAGKGKLYGYKAPQSKILVRGIRAEIARMYVSNGAAPLGSIWCPGDLLEGNAAIGDLYGPDPDWKPAWPM
jgi:hypothetical protein